MPRGGARPGAGRPKKPLAEKVLSGNPGRRTLKVLEFESPALDMPITPDYLGDLAAGVDNCPGAKEIFEQTAAWIETTGCLHLINPEFITEYSILKARWFGCETKNKAGLLAPHPTTGKAMSSPYVRLGLEYLRAADVCWGKIWSIVSQNAERSFKAAPHDDAMERLLSVRNG